MKKALFISYYFPPDGYAGGLRASKFAKYLPENDWCPIVLTSRSPHLEKDKSLLEEIPPCVKIYRTFTLDHDMLLTLFGKSRIDVGKTQKTKRGLVKLESLFLLPDTKALWVYNALPAVLKIFKTENFDLIYSTAPPLTSHIIAVLSGKILRKPVVLDYRDAWYEDPFSFFPTELHRNLIKRIEKFAVTNASVVVAINEVILEGRLKLAHKKGVVIPHGFDPADFPESHPLPDTGNLKLAYAGSINYITNPEPVVRALMDLGLKDIELHFYTSKDPYLAQLTKSEDIIRWHDFVPHTEIVKILPEYHVLVATIDKDVKSPYVSVSKVFDYIGAARPILGVAPKSTYLWKFLSSFDFAYLADASDLNEIKKTLLKMYGDWRRKSLKPVPESIRKKFNRREQAKKLAEIFNEVIG